VRTFLCDRCKCFKSKPTEASDKIIKPRWDGVSLWIGGIELRSYQKRAASEQAAVLDALEQAGWPLQRVQLPEACCHTLSITLYRINEKINDRIIQLQSGGDGKSVLWRRRSEM
jgi:hypothetical protein